MASKEAKGGEEGQIFSKLITIVVVLVSFFLSNSLVYSFARSQKKLYDMIRTTDYLTCVGSGHIRERKKRYSNGIHQRARSLRETLRVTSGSELTCVHWTVAAMAALALVQTEGPHQTTTH